MMMMKMKMLTKRGGMRKLAWQRMTKTKKTSCHPSLQCHTAHEPRPASCDNPPASCHSSHASWPPLLQALLVPSWRPVLSSAGANSSERKLRQKKKKKKKKSARTMNLLVLLLVPVVVVVPIKAHGLFHRVNFGANNIFGHSVHFLESRWLWKEDNETRRMEESRKEIDKK